MELVTDAAHHRLAVFECWRQPRRHSVIGARRPKIPARPDEAVAAPEGEAQSDILCRLGIVGIGVARSVVEQVQDHLPTAIGHVIDEDAARSTRIYWPQDEEVGFVLHHPVRVSRRLVEIGDDAVLRGCRIDFALGDAFDSKIGAGFAKSLPVGESARSYRS